MNPLAPYLWICVWPAIHADLRDADVARDERIAALVRELGHEFPRRIAASQELTNIGEPALPLLKKAAASAPDPEIRWRAAEIFRRISVEP
jgi:HEAT repeat protein